VLEDPVPACCWHTAIMGDCRVGAVPVLSQGDAARSSTEPRGGTRPQLTNVVRCANIHCLTQVASEGWGLVEESNRMFVQSFERGLEVIRSFNEECPRQSLSEVARRTGYSRASCRRLLFTLETLGYVGVDGREFFLQPEYSISGTRSSRHCRFATSSSPSSRT